MAETLPDRENAAQYRAPRQDCCTADLHAKAEHPTPRRVTEPEAHACRLNLTLADFEIVGHIGDGSFSAVVLAIHKGTQQKYAIKLVNKHLVRRELHLHWPCLHCCNMQPQHALAAGRRCCVTRWWTTSRTSVPS